jgi:hypothetical protein
MFGSVALAAEDRNSTFLPSGVQPTASAGRGFEVSRRGSPPAAGTTYTLTIPS